jgi:hypothetical protein
MRVLRCRHSILIGSKDKGIKLLYNRYAFNLTLMPIRCKFSKDMQIEFELRSVYLA